MHRSRQASRIGEYRRSDADPCGGSSLPCRCDGGIGANQLVPNAKLCGGPLKERDRFTV